MYCSEIVQEEGDCWRRIVHFMVCVVLSRREKHVLEGERELGDFIVCGRR